VDIWTLINMRSSEGHLLVIVFLCGHVTCADNFFDTGQMALHPDPQEAEVKLEEMQHIGMVSLAFLIKYTI
jgi:hypothetical protein